jgi:RNA ligase (TIGR02306 family)
MSDIERKLATVEIIKDLQPIPDADAIEVATVRGWHVVVKKGDFFIGDMCVYCEIDSVLPPRPEFEFLEKSKYRIRTIKLRGCLSQGIVFPVSILKDKEILLEPGVDITEILGITKYEPPIPACLSGQVKGNFPYFLHKTDEERIQNNVYLVDKYKGVVFYASEKIDGTSFTCYVKNGEFGVCSRKLELKREDPVRVEVSENDIVDGLNVGNRFDTRNTHWKIVDDNDLENKLKSLNTNIALQGEIIGEGIQGNKYKIKGQVVKFFNAYLIDEDRYLDYFDFENTVCGDLGLEIVPIVSENFILPDTVDELLKLADGKSLLNPNTLREGLVFRPLTESIDSKIGRLSFKVISNAFLDKYKD